MKKMAVVLSGCGFKDGAEITESVSTLIALSQNQVKYQVFAPNETFIATNHLNSEPQNQRNVLDESARIARGKVQNLNELKSEDFDAVIFPGGFGVALHLCRWANDGAACSVHTEAQRIIEEFYKDGKPIGGICIAPALVARVLGSKGITLTIGNDSNAAAEIEKTGAHHVECRVDDYVTDRENKIVTTPAYMYDEAPPYEVFKGISGAIKELVEMA